ncbi:secreted protein [Melampsora americana]|nr:secreted protein [Melampsora americana]
MQFAQKFFTVLALVALVGSALALPVADEQTAGESVLAKRLLGNFGMWNLGGNIVHSGNNWLLGGHPLGNWGGNVVAWNQGQFLNVPQNMWSGVAGFGINLLPNWTGAVGQPVGWF